VNGVRTGLRLGGGLGIHPRRAQAAAAVAAVCPRRLRAIISRKIPRTFPSYPHTHTHTQRSCVFGFFLSRSRRTEACMLFREHAAAAARASV